MAVNLSPIGNGFQFLTTSGLPLAGGLIATYQAGSSTPLATYTDNSGMFPNTNPIVMNSDGRPPSEIWLTAGFNYKFILSDAALVQIASYDNLYGILGAAPTVAPIPSGAIVLWSGSIGSIPVGWNLCDGTNGTPNLKDSFIVGAGNVYPVAGTGGSANTIVVSHNHTATSVVTDPGHTHSSNAVYLVTGGGISGGGTGTANATINPNTTGVTVATTNQPAGTSGTGANLPPYFALAYIQKL